MTPRASRLRRAAFTLTELVVVLGIVALVITVSAPHVAGVLNATRLRTAADAVHGRLLEAQSLAMLFNTDTELRFYEVADLIDASSRPALRKMRILTLQPPEASTASTSDEDVFEPVGSVVHLEQGVEINPTPDYSSIVDLGFTESQNDEKAERYVAVRFRPDGSVGLQGGKPWFLTVHERDAHLRGSKLKNFVTIQIDPATGRLRTFQP